MSDVKKYVEGLVSVIIPTYSRSDTLGRAIQSVLNQTYPQIEILVVDDNEPQSEYSKKVEELISSINANNLYLVTQPCHINGAAARNAGIKVAKGEYISFLDDDDLLLPDKIAVQVEHIKKTQLPIGGVSTRKVFIKDGVVDHLSEKWESSEKQNYYVVSKQQNLQTCTLLLRHDCLDETGYFDERLKRHQEVQLMSFFTQKYRVEYVDQALTIIDSSDTSNRPSAQRLLEFKHDFFTAVGPVLEQYSAHKQKLIFAHNYTELAYAYFRDGDRIKGCILMIKCLIYPSVLIAFVKRVIQRKKNKRAIMNLAPDQLAEIYQNIELCNRVK